MTADVFKGGFSNAPVDAAYAFRAAMTAMARPGGIEEVSGAVPPAPLSVAAGVLLLTLCDPETPVALCGAHACPDVRKWIAFHIGAPVVSPQEAMFAVGTWEALQPLDAYAIGTPDYPDRSATLIVERAELAQAGAVLRGSGIKETAMLSLPDVEPFQRNAMLFPLGLDFFFCAGGRLAALPRTTHVEAG